MVTLVYNTHTKIATLFNGITQRTDCVLEIFTDVSAVDRKDKRYAIITNNGEIKGAIPAYKTILIIK
jgi:hypothetical protein